MAKQQKLRKWLERFDKNVRHKCHHEFENTSKEPRLVQYLKLKVFKCNTQPNVIFKYYPEDIAASIDLIFYEKDIGNDNIKRLRRDGLLQILQRISYRWGVNDHSAFNCNKSNWFKSIPIWIAMQREIDEYNISHQQPQPQPPQPPEKPQSPEPPQQPEPKKKRRRWRREKQMLDNTTNPPEIRNLSVIPICNFKRTHYTMDNFTLYNLLSQLRLLPKKGKAQIKFNEFIGDKGNLWNLYFNMRKIRWFGRRKKEFDFRIRSDGESVSLQYKYKTPKSQSKPLDLDKVRDDYRKQKIKKVLGCDPGLNKWNVTVQRDVKTGKEVSFYLLFNLNHIQIQ